MVDASSLVIPRFHDVLGDVMAHGHAHYWLHGGRGSTKSSFISVCIVLLLLAHPEANAVVVRRFSNTLRDSVFSQLTWAIAALGLDAWFRARISPMELTYLPTGQRIVFRGADDPLKLKGVKFTRGYTAVIWFEELDQFDGIDAVRSILNSLRRGGDDFWIFYSYNPPRTLWSWVNREELERERRADTLVRQSSYLDVIESHPEWLGTPFIEEAEYLRSVDERAVEERVPGRGDGHGWLGVQQRRLGASVRRGVPGLLAHALRGGLGLVSRPVALRALRVGARRAAAHHLRRAVGEQEDALRDGGDGGLGSHLRRWARRGRVPPRRAHLVRRHAGRQAVDGRVAARGRAARAAGEEEQHAAALLRVAGGAARDLHRPGAGAARLRGVPLERVRPRPDGTWLDEIPDGNDHSIDAVRYAMMDDVLRG